MTDPKVEQLRASRRRDNAAERVAYAASMLSEALTLVQVRTTRLEETIQAAADRDVPAYEIEAMTKDGLSDLSFPGVQGMIRRAYAHLYEVTGADTVMWCLAHKRRLRWLPSPAWWIHDDSLPHTGHPGDPRGCRFMLDAPAAITITRKDPS